MEEGEKQEPTDKPAEPNPAAEETSSVDLIEKANKAADRLEASNKKFESLIARQEKQKIENTLGGKAIAGPEQVEESPEDYAKKVMANDFGN